MALFRFALPTVYNDCYDTVSTEPYHHDPTRASDYSYTQQKYRSDAHYVLSSGQRDRYEDKNLSTL